MNLGAWSVIRVTLVSAAWPLLVLSYFAWRLSRIASRGGAAFVSGSLAEFLVLLLGPPFGLILIWLVLKSRTH